MKEFKEWLMSFSGIMITAQCIISGIFMAYGFGFKIGLGVLGAILFYNILAIVR
jgi:hypothetical protein